MEQTLSVCAEYIALIVETVAIAPIAGIRAFLNYFLEKDLKEARSTPGRERIEA